MNAHVDFFYLVSLHSELTAEELAARITFISSRHQLTWWQRFYVGAGLYRYFKSKGFPKKSGAYRFTITLKGRTVKYNLRELPFTA